MTEYRKMESCVGRLHKKSPLHRFTGVIFSLNIHQVCESHIHSLIRTWATCISWTDTEGWILSQGQSLGAEGKFATWKVELQRWIREATWLPVLGCRLANQMTELAKDGWLRQLKSHREAETTAFGAVQPKVWLFLGHRN